jgi:hypothetical protein
VADLRFTAPYSEGHFGALYDVAEMISTIVKIIFQTTAEKYNNKFMGKC